MLGNIGPNFFQVRTLRGVEA